MVTIPLSGLMGQFIQFERAMGKPKRNATMADVAKDAGVGTITVSRALRDPSKVSEGTLRAVLASVTKLGYVLDETAASLSSKRSRIVGAVVSTLDQSIFSATIRGLATGLQTRGQQLLLATTDYDEDRESELITAMIGRKPEALVLTSSEHRINAVQRIRAANIPTIECWEIPTHPICAAVGFSNREAGRSITHHLLALGRKKIAYLGAQREGDTRGRLRHSGYEEIVVQKHVPLNHLEVPEEKYFGPDYGATGFRKIIARWPDVDAIVCASDAIAFGAFCEAIRQGFQVPNDLAITGFGDFDYARDSGVGLTTVRIDGEKIGQATADLIEQSHDGIDITGKIIDVGFEIVRRRTS